MARFHVRATPPKSPLLFEYGREFPDIFAALRTCRVDAWLADVARIERAWLDAYHAADAEPLAPQLLASIGTGAARRNGTPPSHPASRIVRSPYQAVSIFASNCASGPVGRITATEPEDALMHPTGARGGHRQELFHSGGAVFLTHLAMGEPLGAAAAAALVASPTFDLGCSIAGMLQAGAFTAIDQGSR